MWYQKTAEEVESVFCTDGKRGLSSWEHDRRLEKNGLNVLEKKKRNSPLGIFFRQFCDFMILVLMAAAAVSAMLGETADALMIIGIILMNSILGFFQEYKAERSLGALKKLTEDEARILLGGELKIKKAEELVVGDVVILEPGTKVPADLRLTEAFRLQADESILTGEAKTVKKNTEVCSEDRPLSERSNMCYSGTVITSGRGRGIVVAVGMYTELGKIAGMLRRASSDATPLQRQLKKLGKLLIMVCSVVCVLVTVAGALRGGDLYEMVLTGVSLGVASIPEGLPIIVTVALALGVRRLTAVHAIVRRLPAIETLGCVTCICTDKTGTLTKSHMETDSFFGNGRWHDLKAFGKTGRLAEETNLVLGNCHNLYRDGNSFRGDPTEEALYYGAVNDGAPMPKVYRMDEIAFDSQRKRMSVRGEYGGRNYSLVKGAPDHVFPYCSFVVTEKGRVPFTGEEKKRWNDALSEKTFSGGRVLAVAIGYDVDSPEKMEQDLTLLSLASICDPLRDNAAESLKKASVAGVRSIMITGDQPGTALAIGRELGIARSGKDLISGREMERMDDVALSEHLRKVSVIASATPADKMRVVSLLKSKGETCAMTGDGVNDAPALKEADIGIAMGQKGTDVTKESADLILADDDFSSIVAAIAEGRGIYDNIRKTLRYLLSSNLGEIMVMFLSVALCFPLPLLPLQILWINFVTDGLPSMALTMDPPRVALMEEPPRDGKASVFSDGMGVKILSRGIFIGIVCFAAFLTGIWRCGDLSVARTMAFNALVFSQLFYIFDCRGPEGVIGGKNFFSNPFLWVTFLISVLLQFFVIYFPLCRNLFYTVPLSLTDFGLSIAFSFLPSAVSFVFLSKNAKKNEKIYKKRRK